jgi:GH25 family lysozyme M1 (1,4-beta-N-acetylmuramidase)
MLEILGEYQLDLPIILDWEIPGAENPRTKNMDARTLTEIQKYFCQVMTEKGYDPMIYFNWHQAKNLYYLSELEDYDFWLASYTDRMNFPYKVKMWQYTESGSIPGIDTPCDFNVYFPDGDELSHSN